MPPVRPSSLQMAEECERAPYLGQRYREGNENTRRGNDIDIDVSTVLVGGGEARTKEGRMLAAWVRERFGDDATFLIQRKVRLVDPVTGEVITEGTPDLLVLHQVGERLRLTVVDWKTIGQFFAGYLELPDNNLQQGAYAVAAAMEFGAEEYQIILACFDERGIKPIEGSVLEGEAWWPLLERIKAIPHVNLEGPEPEATKGEHCDRCWQKMHCSAFLLPAVEGKLPVELVPFSEVGQGLTSTEAVAGLEWLEHADEAIARAKKLRDLVEGQLKTFATVNGPLVDGDRQWGPIATNGQRRGPNLGELEEMGLGHLIKPGKPGVKFDWKKVA